jgi:hypothetical protein
MRQPDTIPHMEQLMHEDVPQYDTRCKVILFAAPALTLFLALLTGLDAYGLDILGSETAASSKMAAVILLATTVSILAVYWAVLPKKFSIFLDRVEIKFGLLRLNIGIGKIDRARIVTGRMSSPGFGCITSTNSIVEISINNGFNVRISPTNGKLFLKSLHKATEPEPVEVDPLQLLK